MVVARYCRRPRAGAGAGAGRGCQTLVSRHLAMVRKSTLIASGAGAARKSKQRNNADDA